MSDFLSEDDYKKLEEKYKNGEMKDEGVEKAWHTYNANKQNPPLSAVIILQNFLVGGNVLNTNLPIAPSRVDSPVIKLD